MIIGIPSEVSNSDRKDVLRCIVNKAGVAIKDNDINNYHHVGKLLKNKFTRRKEQILCIKKRFE